jgi:hypothetical protein
MPYYKVVPFTAQITRDDTTVQVAAQMQNIIDAHLSSGWEYVRMEGVQTNVAGTSGCFGVGAQPGFSTTFNVMVFKQ